jgi:hypothetical protein
MPTQHHPVAPPVIIAATPVRPLAAPQPAIAPSLPPVCTVDLMTLEGSAMFGAQWKTVVSLNCCDGQIGNDGHNR